MVVFPKCTNTSCAEFDPLILKLNIRTVVIIKELDAGNLKTPHVKIPRSQSDTGKRRSFFRLLIGRMATGGKLCIRDSSCPDRWGRLLMRRKEAIDARNEDRKPRNLTESDFLLGVYDESRMGALRFSLEDGGDFLRCV